MRIDIVIPCAPKDTDTLGICLKSCKRHITDEIANIFVISCNNEAIKKICEEYSAIWVDEDKVLDRKLSDVIATHPTYNRWGWMYQQFLKMSGNIGECENYLGVDSDGTVTKDINFFENGNPIFYYRDDYHHPPFFDVMNKIIDIKRFYETSFVCDFMVFNRKVMSDLKKHIEEHTGENWIDAIIHRIDYSLSPFSEFETYGTFYEGEMIIRKVEYKQLDYLETDLDKQEKNNPDFRAVVMPRYLRK